MTRSDSMTPPNLIMRGLLLLATLLVVSCSPQQPASDASKQPESEDTVVELRVVPEPNLTAMESDIAILLASSRELLEATLTDTTLDDVERAEAYADYGLVAFGNGLVIPAEAAFDNATRLAPDDARWVYFLALMHELTGELDKAAAGFERTLELRTDNLPTLIRLGNVRFEQALLEQAQRRYEQALKLNPDSAAALYGLGRVASANSEHQQAVSFFEQALALQPQADQINYLLGLAWRNLGDTDRARDFLAKRGPNKPGFDDPLFDQISGGETRIGGMWADMSEGSQAFVDGDYTRAVELFRKATINHADDSRSWQSLGMGLLKLNDIQGAENAYNQALQLSADNAVVLHELANLKIASGRVNDAEQHLLRAIEIDPRMLAAHTTLAGLLRNTQRAEQALERYRIALELDPQSTELAISRAETLLELGRTDDALKDLEAAIAINPKNSPVRLTYGLVLAEGGNIEEARNQINAALLAAEDDSTRASAHYAMGTVALMRGDGDQAIQALGNAVRLNPGHRAAGLGLARTYMRMRNYPQAVSSYEALLSHWPANDGARVEAAKGALLLGDGAKAHSLLKAGVDRPQASAFLLGTFARLLVLTTDTNVRDPRLAVSIAQRALKLSDASQHMETLALCHAANNQYTRAVQLQEQLLAKYRTEVSSAVWQRMEKNLSSYRAGVVGRLPFEAI